MKRISIVVTLVGLLSFLNAQEDVELLMPHSFGIKNYSKLSIADTNLIPLFIKHIDSDKQQSIFFCNDLYSSTIPWTYAGVDAAKCIERIMEPNFDFPLLVKKDAGTSLTMEDMSNIKALYERWWQSGQRERGALEETEYQWEDCPRTKGEFLNDSMALSQPAHIIRTHYFTLTPANAFAPAFDTIYRGVEYTIAVEDEKIAIISTRDPNFALDGLRVGNHLSDKYKGEEIKLIKGWGRYVKLRDGWYAATSFESKGDFVIQWFFQYDFH